jgi:hypothetical protein
MRYTLQPLVALLLTTSTLQQPVAAMCICRMRRPRRCVSDYG